MKQIQIGEPFHVRVREDAQIPTPNGGEALLQVASVVPIWQAIQATSRLQRTRVFPDMNSVHALWIYPRMTRA